jgi:hypothetical protein
MNPNSEDIVQQIKDKFEALLAYVSQTQGETPSIYQVERHLLTHLLSLGRALLLAFILTQQAQIKEIATVCVNGKVLGLHGRKKRSLRSIFGKITFERGYYYREGKSYFLLDARLKLPENSLSDLLREWLCQLACYVPYHRSGSLLQDVISQKLTTRPLEEAVAEDSTLVEDFYKQAPTPLPATEASILAAQADGKGVPLIVESGQPVRVRLGKGEKLGRKKEAIVTSVYTIAPCVRTPEEVTQSLFKQTTTPVCRHKKRIGPQNKRLWATLEGKKAALEFTALQVALREGEHIKMRVALTDGSAPLQDQVRVSLPAFTLILDIIHAVEYLWEAGNSLHGEKSDKRDPWVQERVLLLLCGQTDTVISQLRALAATPSRKKTTKAVLLKVVGYYERNQAYMHYDKYLAEGWPIATGVIEGACRHLVKDRCELAGMHWSIAGAEALLRLRSVAENGDWESFHEFRRERLHLRLYGSCVNGDATTIEMAAAEARMQEAECQAA